VNIKIEINEKNNGKLVFVEGEIDAYTAPALREKIVPLTEKEGLNVTIDLSGVNYMDSTGLGVLIGAYKSSQKYGSFLKITGLTERVERLFEITGLMEIMDIETTVRGEMK
jgi:anti-sigma B factor antagonist